MKELVYWFRKEKNTAVLMKKNFSNYLMHYKFSDVEKLPYYTYFV